LQLDSQAPPGAEGAREGEGQGRRRRRRGGRGGERNRGERGPRESFGAEASPADAIESHAPQLEEARAPAARHEPVDESHDHAPAVHEHVEARSEPAQQQPQPIAAAFAPHAPVAFRSVSQHDEAEGESGSHRPQRKRRHGGEGHADEPQQLQLVETQHDAPTAPPVEDDEPQRRTKPRRRRAQVADDEPLKLVETHPGTQPPQDGAPTQ
jgi:ribonuclease E